MAKMMGVIELSKMGCATQSANERCVISLAKVRFAIQVAKVMYVILLNQNKSCDAVG